MSPKFRAFPDNFSSQYAKTTSGYIYVFSIGHDNLYKVGKSVNWERRLKSLKAANPQLKSVLNVRVKNRHDAESTVHKAIELHKVEREIFRLQEKDIELIRNILMRFVE